MIKICIADKSYLIREGLKSIIAPINDFIVVSEPQNSQELQEIIMLKEVDVFVIDYFSFSMDDLNYLMQQALSKKTLCITHHITKDTIKKVMNAGVSSHILKDCDHNEIIEAIYATAKGEKFFCGKILETLSQKENSSFSYSCQGVNISVREAEIIKFIAAGYTNKEIADKLFLSNHTVTTHRKNIMSKLGVNNTAGLILYALKENIIQTNFAKTL